MLKVRNKIVEEKLFGVDSKPHVFCINSIEDSKEYRNNVWGQSRFKVLGFGTILFFGNMYIGGENNITEDGYTLPDGYKEEVKAWQDLGYKVMAYMHCVSWSEHKMGPFKALDFFKNLGVNSVYLDNGEMSTPEMIDKPEYRKMGGPSCTHDFFKRLKMYGFEICHHCTIEPWPWLGYNDQNRGPWSEFQD